VDVPATGGLFGSDSGHALSPRVDGDRSLLTLRARWRTASLAAGWLFPSDWALPEVNAVCAAVIRGGRAETALAGLAGARAAAGTGLAETLMDMAALHAVLAEAEFGDGSVAPDVDATPARLLRLTAVAWADVATDRLANTEVSDPMTGLPTAAYLRTRLSEVYRRAVRNERRVADEHLLLVVSMDFSAVPGWSRLIGMILVAEAARAVFDGGESIATSGPSTAAALVPRDGRIASRGALLRRELHERLAVDAQLREVGQARISVVRLPLTHHGACELLAKLGHG
jgi:hypothetical protein